MPLDQGDITQVYMNMTAEEAFPYSNLDTQSELSSSTAPTTPSTSATTDDSSLTFDMGPSPPPTPKLLAHELALMPSVPYPVVKTQLDRQRSTSTVYGSTSWDYLVKRPSGTGRRSSPILSKYSSSRKTLCLWLTVIALIVICLVVGVTLIAVFGSSGGDESAKTLPSTNTTKWVHL